MQSNFRTLIFYIIILTLVFLPLKIVLAGQDDSGLKVVTIEGKDLWGIASGNMRPNYLEESNSSIFCENFVFDGNSMIPVNTSGTSGTTSVIDFYQTPTTSFSLTVSTSGITNEVSITSSGSSGSETRTSSTYLLRYNYPSGYPGYSFFCFDDLYGGVIRTLAVTTPYIKIYNAGTYVTQITNPITSYGTNFTAYFDIWSGRLFIGGGSYLLYSSASDKTDFTVSSTAGGVIRVPDSSYIIGMLSTVQGLAVITNTGFWLLSGVDTPESWTFQQIKKITPEYALKTSQGQLIIFETNGGNIYLLDGITLQFITNIDIFSQFYSDTLAAKTLFPVSAEINQNKQLFFECCSAKTFIPGSLETEFLVNLDLTSLKYSKIPVLSMVKNSYYTKDGYDSSLFGIEGMYLPYVNNTSEIGSFIFSNSLDGNLSTRKNIVRIETDFLTVSGAVNPQISITANKYRSDEETKTFTLNLTTELSRTVSTQIRTIVSNFNVNCNLSTIYITTTGVPIKRIRIYYRDIGNYKKRSTL